LQERIGTNGVSHSIISSGRTSRHVVPQDSTQIFLLALRRGLAGDALDAFYQGQPDSVTLRMLGTV